MGTYIMSDIHGCCDQFLHMLDKIGFSATDRLILAGDCIDRGEQSCEMLRWMEHAPENVLLLRGNHEEEFAAYVDLMCRMDRCEKLDTDFTSNADTVILYETVQYYIRQKGISVSYFDVYGTIGNLLAHYNITLAQLCKWADMVRKMPYTHEFKIQDKTCIVVHAGYADSLGDIGSGFTSLEQFYLYAREESYESGGRQHAVIVAGHTPTVAEGEFAYNAGNVFRYYNPAKDCVFYNIDCGCVFRRSIPDAKLACIRMEDEKIFYV